MARQRAPRHLARQWAPSQTGTDMCGTGSSGYRIVWARQQASGHQATGHLARQRAPASSGKAVGTESPG
ncbi:unnamed protein product, partial [Staurois parvus]